MTQDPGLASWLQLTLTPGLGAASLRAMLKQFGLPQAILQRKRSELAPFASAQALAALDSSAVREAVTRSLEWALAPGRAIITLADDDYPRSLLEIADPPALLYAAGLWPVSLMPLVVGLAGPVYGAVATILGLVFIWLSFRFMQERSHQSARRLFLFSLMYLAILWGVLVVDRLWL